MSSTDIRDGFSRYMEIYNNSKIASIGDMCVAMRGCGAQSPAPKPQYNPAEIWSVRQNPL